MVSLVTTMPRRKPTEDVVDRKPRLRAMTQAELLDLAGALKSNEDQLRTIVKLMDKHDLESIDVDGAEKPYRALELLETWLIATDKGYKLAKRAR